MRGKLAKALFNERHRIVRLEHRANAASMCFIIGSASDATLLYLIRFEPNCRGSTYTVADRFDSIYQGFGAVNCSHQAC